MYTGIFLCVIIYMGNFKRKRNLLMRIRNFCGLHGMQNLLSKLIPDKLTPKVVVDHVRDRYDCFVDL